MFQLCTFNVLITITPSLHLPIKRKQRERERERERETDRQTEGHCIRRAMAGVVFPPAYSPDL